tara:strand:- start:535 stop:831 length:297 start_codon:yes stop_codon:yes gene_type:complete
MQKKNKRIVCKDGFSMSVQANEYAYCTPRMDNAPAYSEVEIGYPSQPEHLLMPWAENEEAPCKTVYGYVPRQRVMLVIAKHGGMVEGELPNGIPELNP